MTGRINQSLIQRTRAFIQHDAELFEMPAPFLAAIYSLFCILGLTALTVLTVFAAIGLVALWTTLGILSTPVFAAIAALARFIWQITRPETPQRSNHHAEDR